MKKKGGEIPVGIKCIRNELCHILLKCIQSNTIYPFLNGGNAKQ